MTAIVCMALSAAGLVIAVLTALRGRIRAGLRWAAVALVPTGLYLTGLIPVFDRIGRSLGSWGTHLVFDPRVWTGVAMLGVAVLVLLATGFGRSRAPRAMKPAKPVSRAAAGPAGATQALAPVKQQQAKPDDFSDIEDILKRRGI
ncbi:hypothetical protein ABIA33_001894 [Streptacidiphilus sp. MAP12-16]|uniref:hypothetical protein n=1 Tax=Streptacidiphilus sp. MAP12-16 TaxID=3156300 RepID=UPI003515E2F9